MMNWKSMSKVLIPLSCLSFSCLFADSAMISDCKTDCPKPKQVPCAQPKKTECVPCVPCVKEGMTPFVLTTSRPCNDLGIYFFADALYWQADIGNSDWVCLQTAPAGVFVPGKIKKLNFKWNWGFKVGLGFDMGHDEWDIDFYYTWFVNKTQPSHFNLTGSAFVAMPLNTDLGLGSFATGSASARLNFNVLDWELGRWFYISDSISMRPHAGLKGSWIHLKEEESFSSNLFTSPPVNLTSYHAQNKSKSWGIGPSIGVNSNWYFGSGNTIDPCDGHVRSRPSFSIFGDFSGALLYSHFSNSHTESSTGPANASPLGFHPTSLSRHLMVPVLTGFMGLAYDMCFNCDKYHFGLRLGYELQYWFRQNQQFEFNDRVPPRYTRSTSEDLALQGMTIDARFDF